MQISNQNATEISSDGTPVSAYPPHKLINADSKHENTYASSHNRLDLGSKPRTELVNDEIAASYLGVSKGTLSVWRSTGRYPLRYRKIGRRVRYMIGDILDFVDSRAHLHT